MLNLCKVCGIAMHGDKTFIQAILIPFSKKKKKENQVKSLLKRIIWFFFSVLSRQRHDLANTLTQTPYPNQKLCYFVLKHSENEYVSS